MPPSTVNSIQLKKNEVVEVLEKASPISHQVEGETVKIGHGTTDWFQIGKGVHQVPCLFNLCMQST